MVPSSSLTRYASATYQSSIQRSDGRTVLSAEWTDRGWLACRVYLHVGRVSHLLRFHPSCWNDAGSSSRCSSLCSMILASFPGRRPQHSKASSLCGALAQSCRKSISTRCLSSSRCTDDDLDTFNLINNALSEIQKMPSRIGIAWTRFCH